VRKIKSVIMALLALALIWWLYDHYLRPGAVDIRLVTREEGKVVYCRYCGGEISREVREVRVAPAEAANHIVYRERGICAECWEKHMR